MLKLFFSSLADHFLTILCISFIFISCSSSQKNNSLKKETRDPVMDNSASAFDTQGHRGCRGLMPENTIPAMINAAGMYIATLEMDICISKDKKVFLSHEPFFNHEISTRPDGGYITADEERNFNTYQMNYDAIIKYDVGMKPHPRFPKQQKMKAVKPLLADVFKAVKEYMMTARRPDPFFNIETKSLPAGDHIYHPEPAEFVELLMAVIKENQMEKFVIIQSFDIRTLQYLHLHYPKIKTALLIESFNKIKFSGQLSGLGFTPAIYSPEFSLVTAELIKSCHALDMKIIPWTVNDKKKIDELKRMGVDGIITDYPDLFFE